MTIDHEVECAKATALAHIERIRLELDPAKVAPLDLDHVLEISERRAAEWVDVASPLNELEVWENLDDLLGELEADATRVIEPLERLPSLLLAGGAPSSDEPTSWVAVNLDDALNGVDVPPPSIYARSDDRCLLYAGRTHGFAGESESLKSMAAQHATGQVLALGLDVLYIDFEDDERSVVGRLRSLGATAEAIRAHLVYVRPEEPLRGRDGRLTRAGLDFGKLRTLRPWALVVIDGVTEAMVTGGYDLLSNADIAAWSRELPKPLADTGAAVVMIDHVPKSSENRGRYAIGGQHKLAGMTGAQYVFEVERPLSRALVEPITGVVKITVTKDRPGHVRTHALDGVVGRFEVTSYPDGGLAAKVLAPTDRDETFDLRLAGRIADYLTTYAGASKTNIEASVQGKAGAIRSTLMLMVAKGFVAVTPVGQTHKHTLTPTGSDYFE